jgi:hypothetical protein
MRKELQLERLSRPSVSGYESAFNKTAVIYSYDPLDRLIGTPSGKRFYQGARITTEIKDERACCVFQHDTHVLAQHQQEQGVNTTTLLATDIQGSGLKASPKSVP